MLEKITLAVLFFAFVLPLCTSRHFYKTNDLGMSQFYMFMAEAFAMLVTFIFALFHYTGNANLIAADAQWWMRISMGFAAILSTCRVYVVVTRIIENERG